MEKKTLRAQRAGRVGERRKRKEKEEEKKRRTLRQVLGNLCLKGPLSERPKKREAFFCGRGVFLLVGVCLLPGLLDYIPLLAARVRIPESDALETVGYILLR